jgi:hypothetical protein
MHRSRAPSIAPGTFFVAQPWADCITNMPGFNLRQAQPIVALKARCHSKLLTALAGMNCISKKMVQLVGFRDPNARKHEGAASVVTVLASAA